LRYALLFTTTAVDIVKAANALIAKAFSGDVAAIKLFFHYVLGKPTEPIDPDRIAIDEWQKLKEKAIPPEEMTEVMQQCPAQLANDFVNENWPGEIRRNLREAREENEELEATVAQDFRDMEEMEKLEEEALRQKAQAQAARSASEQRSAPEPVAPPSSNGETAEELETECADPVDRAEQMIDAIMSFPFVSREDLSRFSDRLDSTARSSGKEMVEIMRSWPKRPRPSSNGEKTATAKRG
jgi:hypothetical protein